MQQKIKIGDALLQKTYTVDVLTKKRVSNNGIVPHYYVENNHEAIIPRQLFMQFQEELLRRAHLKTENGKTKEDTPWMFDSNDLDEYGNYDPYRDPEIREPLEGAQKMADMGCATHRLSLCRGIRGGFYNRGGFKTTNKSLHGLS